MHSNWSKINHNCHIVDKQTDLLSTLKTSNNKLLRYSLLLKCNIVEKMRSHTQTHTYSKERRPNTEYHKLHATFDV